MSWILIGKCSTGIYKFDLGSGYTPSQLEAAKRKVRNSFKKTWGRSAKGVKFKWEVKWQ